MFFERALLAETISDPKRKKTILFFLWFWSLLSTTSMVFEGCKLLGPFFFAGIPLRGLISKIPSTYAFFERALLAETISDPKRKKTILFFLWFWSLLSTTSMVYEGSRVKTFGPLSFKQEYLAGSNIKNSIHIRVFWTCTPGRNHFRPQGQKNYLILSLILVFVVHHRYGLWRLKSENFWATFF